ncbi:MAG: hypothetical protein JXQ73_18595 [Phycisphaerae bacterium]|nr:hypothetical protein [Phycisphaerae bacterium]
MADENVKSKTLGHAGSGAEGPTFANHDPASHRRRDAEAMTIIGGFLAILAALVLIGVVWNDEGLSLRVGIGAGALLMAVGLGGVFLGMRLRRVRD